MLEFSDRDIADLVVEHSVVVDARTGTATVVVPVRVSSGRAGLSPSLSLQYSSTGGNSPFGMGWSLTGLPGVTLDADGGVPRHDDCESYSFAGERLVPWLEQSGARWKQRATTVDGFAVQYFRRQFERGARLRFERWVELSSARVHWRVRDERNIVTVLGNGGDGLGRVTDPGDDRRVFAWLPEARYDPYGNALTVVYGAEDTRGVVAGAEIYERGHLGAPQPQRYPKRIRYGNAAPLAPDDTLPGAEAWNFELVCDYGDHSGDTPGPDPDIVWAVRADPYSTGRAGFEVRTWRLCRRLLMFHRFPELGSGATLVGVTGLEHDERASGSRLRSITLTGVRRDGSRRSAPPLILRYSESTVASVMEAAPASARENTPAGLTGGAQQLVDLRGEGLPGILTETNDAWYYKANLGGGQFAPIERVAERPSTRAGVLGFGDFDRDGNADMVSLQGRYPGLARFDRASQRWSAYRPFDRAPRIEATGAGWLDVDGDGRFEVVQRSPFGLTWYPVEGAHGFGAATTVAMPALTADTAAFEESVDQRLFLADMNGDGLADQVRVDNGHVEYWPNLGNGAFGNRVVMGGDPGGGFMFAPEGSFDPGRLRFADLDGSGTTDLLYLGSGELRWWRNESGNRLVEGQRVGGLPYFDTVTPAQVLDVLGDGTACLIWSSPLPGQPEPLRFLRLQTSRPNLLVDVDDSAGRVTRLTYGSSADHYLRDLRAGRPWTTRLPVHITVVDRHEVEDRVTGLTTVSRFAYRDGAFDGDEHTFGGFALVDRFDAEALIGKADDPDEVSRPSCTRTWFHTGDPQWHRTLAWAYAEDSAVEPLPACTVADLDRLTVREHRDALRCVTGQALREEVYAVVGPGDALATHPFQVTQVRMEVRRAQPAYEREQRDRPAVLTVHTAERVKMDYEQQPGDPRVTHHLALDVDEDGQVLLDCHLAYPRRSTAVPVTPAQAVGVATVTRQRVASFNTAARFEIGIPVESEEFELAGLPAAGDAVLALPDVVTAVRTALSEGSAQRVGWDRSLYWDSARADAAPLGDIGVPALLHHEESAVFEAALVADVYGGRVDPALLSELGYCYRDALWWRPDPVQHHAGADRFFTLKRTERWDGATTTFAWDPHHLIVTGVTDAVGNTSTAIVDYHLLAPRAATDANEAVWEVAYDPLGVAVVTTTHGTVGDTGYGHLPLSAHSPRPDAPVDDVLADPGRFLQGSASFTAYDLTSIPRRVVTLTRETFVRDGSGGRTTLEGPVQVRIAHLDGLGRVVQEKIRIEPGPAIQRDRSGGVVVGVDGAPVEAEASVRWLTSAWVVFDARQQPVREYQPYFSLSPAFEDDEVLRGFGTARCTRYDAVGRPIREDEPDGTYARTEYTAWEIRYFDRNDTVADSRYRLERDALPASDVEKQALMGALAHAGTPGVSALDPLGREVSRQDSTGEGGRVITTAIDAAGEPVAATDGRGLVVLTLRRDLLGRVVKTESVDAGQTWTLPDAADREAHVWDGRDVHVTRHHDALDRTVSTRVDGVPGLHHLVEDIQYGEDPAVSDAASRNLRGRMVRHCDHAGVVTVDRYDPFGKVLRSERRLRAEVRTEPDWSDVATVALEPEAFVSEGAYDALGRLARASAPDGSVRRYTYLLSGGVGRISWELADGSEAETAVLDATVYNARGQRTRYQLGNGVTVEQRFDPATARVTTVTATSGGGAGGGGRVLQDLAYTYDPVGNVTHMVDAAHQPAAATPLVQGASVSSHRAFTYDAVYQLKTASGRVHQALLEHDATNGFRGTRHLSLNNAQAVERYTETYDYNLAGGLVRITHRGPHNWTTNKWISSTSNRALPATHGGIPVTDSESRFDAAGNCTWLPNVRELRWSYRNQLQCAVVIDRSAAGQPDDAETYVYDAQNMRIRKVTDRLVNGSVETTEKLYLDGCEIKRVRKGATLVLERRTSRIHDGDAVVAQVHRWTTDTSRRETDTTSDHKTTYPLHDHIGSSSLELDEDGGVLGYEEFLPYGGTAFIAGRSERDSSIKDHRYAGKERDDATGLYYFGFRYYAPWIGNWISPDPGGPTDSLNLYQFALSNPVGFVDDEGLQARSATLGSIRSVPEPEWRPAWDALTPEQQAAHVAAGRVFYQYDPSTQVTTFMTEQEMLKRVESALKIADVFVAQPGVGSGGLESTGAAQDTAAGTEILFEDDIITVDSTEKQRGDGVGESHLRPVGDPAAGGGGKSTNSPEPANGAGQVVNQVPGSGQGSGGSGGVAGAKGGQGAGRGNGIGASAADGQGITSGAENRDVSSRDQSALSERARDGVHGGVDGGERGGVLGGTVGSGDTGSVDGRVLEGTAGANGFSPNGMPSGDRFSTFDGTGTRPGGASTGQGQGTGGKRGADPRGTGRRSGGQETRPTTLDKLSRYAGYLDLEFGGDKRDGVSGGIPGGLSLLGLRGPQVQAAYIALTVASFLLGAGIAKTVVRAILRQGLRAGLRTVIRRLTRSITRFLFEDRLGSQAIRRAPLSRDFFNYWRWLFGSNHRWSLEHAFIKQRWYRGASPVFAPGTRLNRLMQGLGDAGWNLIPMPRAFNSAMFRWPKVSLALNLGTYSGLAYGQYELWSWVSSVWSPILSPTPQRDPAPSGAPGSSP